MQTEKAGIIVTEKSIYNRAKMWQIALFALNNSATNVTMFLMGFYAFFTQNVLGLTAVIAGSIAMSMRIWDAFTDPIVGFFLDRTNGKFGKFRPYMLIGNLIMFFSVIAIFRVPATLPASSKLLYTSALYVIYIIGYTFQCTVTKGAQACLTNDPKQRPTIALFDSIYNALVFSGGAYILTTVMATQYKKNMIDPQLWKDASVVFMTISLVLTILAIIGIWQKDRTEFFGLGENSAKVKFKDYFEIIKNNRPIKVLIVAACIDKLAISGSRAGLTYFFANILLNNSLQGKFSLAAVVPGIIIAFVGVNWARKTDTKKAFLTSIWISTVFLVLILATVPVLAKPGFGSGVIVLLIAICIQQSTLTAATAMVNPMIADCSDYETYRSGRFIPGMMGTVFSFVDKLISSLSTFIIGLAITWAGYGSSIIKPNTPTNSKFHIAVYFILFGLPLLGNIIAIISMKFYELDAAMMKKVRETINEKKLKASNN
jgi:Na+/melibiose symporter-like transporter